MTASWFAAKQFSDYVDSEYRKAFSPLGLKVSEARIMLALYERPCPSLKELSTAVGLSVGHVSRIINNLEAKGYVQTRYIKNGIGYAHKAICLALKGEAVCDELRSRVSRVERTIQASVFDFFPIGAAV